jgi:hypothetical protein
MNSEIPKPQKRIARPQATEPRKANLDSMLQDIYLIFRKDIDYLGSLNVRNETQARILQGHAKMLLDIQKEQRIADKEDREATKKMSDTDIINHIVSNPTLLSVIKKAIEDSE